MCFDVAYAVTANEPEGRISCGLVPKKRSTVWCSVPKSNSDIVEHLKGLKTYTIRP